jgi:hypothetical protein
VYLRRNFCGTTVNFCCYSRNNLEHFLLSLTHTTEHYKLDLTPLFYRQFFFVFDVVFEYLFSIASDITAVRILKLGMSDQTKNLRKNIKGLDVADVIQ